MSSDTSADNLPAPQPVLVDLDSSLESLPNINPSPQFQLPIEPLVDLGDLNITQDFPPPLQHQVFREAYVLLSRLQLPPLQPLTPPLESPQQPLAPPLDQEVWVDLEATVARFDAPQQVVLPQPLMVLQPEVVVSPQYVPVALVQPQPLGQVDWAGIAYVLFTIAEKENQQRANNPNELTAYITLLF